MSYRELDERSNQLGHYLRERGVREETLVAICMDRSVELIIGILGILKAGGAYVPIDPGYPEERIRYTVEDAGGGVVVTTEGYRGLFGEGGKVVLLDGEKERIGRSPKGRLDVGVRPDQLAYVIYTSGSTGKPKGVMIEHMNVVNLICWHIQAYSVDFQSRSTTMAGVGFDANSLEVWSALLSGSCLYVVNNEVRLNSEQLINFYSDNDITHAFVPPILIPDLVRCRQPQHLALKYVLIGGDQLQAVDLDRISYTLVNQYGPTESTVMVDDDHSVNKDDAKRKSLPIGKPIWNTQIYILDGGMEPVPVGVPGEIYIGGDGVARGYLNRAGADGGEVRGRSVSGRGTDVPDGRSGTMAGGWEHRVPGAGGPAGKGAGIPDRAGRDRERCWGLPGGAGSVVVVREDTPGDKRLVGYVVCGGSRTAAEMRRWVLERLPEYMVPAVCVKLERLPLSPNGKVDRKSCRRRNTEDWGAGSTWKPGRGRRNDRGGSGRKCCGWSEWGSRTTFSSWAATRC